uniref:Polypeptide N-acetylgalactosaminyltransferase 10 n=1 Tax=Ascaris lumbricoides TaxID=6252 RepID=A0A0M3IHJ2_ASCLU
MTAGKLPGPRRKRIRKALYISLFILAFLMCWCLLTILILLAQEKIFTTSEENIIDQNSYAGRGIQVVVGHYNGNLPAEKRANLTEEQLNANRFSPVPGVGEDGRPVKLDELEDRLSDDTFGINQEISEQLNANRFSPVPGVGEDGRPVKLDELEDRLSDDTFGINQFNLIISDKIALNRSLPDVRKHQCRDKIYPGSSHISYQSLL